MTQSSLWQESKQNNAYAEICNALYERELSVLAQAKIPSVATLQNRLKSLPHYINKTANLMTKVNEQGKSPLTLDIQNATWSAKQQGQLPLMGEENESISSWYNNLIEQPNNILLGLVVPVLMEDHIILDCIDAIDEPKQRLRTNVSGWFSLNELPTEQLTTNSKSTLLKPNKRVMLAACAGHRWQDRSHKSKRRPIIPTLRELLLSCSINWQNFKQPIR